MGKLRQLWDDMMLGLKQSQERNKLQREKDKEFKELRQKQKFEQDKTTLERESELEGVKAEIRKKQSIAPPKLGQQQQNKSAFAKFQDFATNYANNQPKGQSAFGNMNLGGSSVPQQDKPKPNKKKRKKQKVKMMYVPMNQFGNNVKTVWR